MKNVAPLEHAGPLDLEPHVHDTVIRGRYVEHCHGCGADEGVIERLATQLGDRHLDVRMAVEDAPPERECDVERSPAPAIPRPYLKRHRERKGIVEIRARDRGRAGIRAVD